MAYLVLMVLLFAALPVQAQDPPPVPPIEGDPSSYLSMEITYPMGAEMTIATYAEKKTFRFTIHDLSRDGTGEGGLGQPHEFDIAVTPLVDATGWTIQQNPKALQMRAGQSQDVTVSFIPLGTAVNFDLRMAINVTMTAQYSSENVTSSGTFLVRSPGSQIAILRTVGNPTFVSGPDDIFDVQLRISNPGLLGRSYRVAAADNPCGFKVTDATVFIPPGETMELTMSAIAPAEKPYYNYESCLLSFRATDLDSRSQSSSATFIVTVKGAYVDPGWIINLVIAAALIAGFVYFILILKRRAEEEVLGKPQPPWTLPAEQLYLQELEAKDPRAAYVVRHFLMEDEYQSSLMWYRAYKKATRGRRVMERRVLKMERSFERWDARQQVRLDRQGDTGDKDVDRLQAKLDKKSRKSFKKEHKKWRKQVSKLETKAANAHNKALGEYRKELKKATKKGLPEPARPVMDGPELPPEPEQEHVLLDEHKWASKKDKIYARAARDEEKAYERYDKERSKRLETMRKKMEKMADKIDDPTFVAEHPLLQDAIASSN